jgi:hypothetical protein
MPDEFKHYPEFPFKGMFDPLELREINYLKGFPHFDGKRKGDYDPPSSS